jgi:Mg/Co/Ni transporter MgtE
MDEMAPDQAADALGELEEETSAGILDEMDTEPVSEVRELLEYDEDTAGGMMNTEAIVLGEEMLLADAIVRLRDQADALESTHAVFLSNQEGRITAQVPAARLFLGDPRSPLRSLADGRLISTRADETQKRVTELFDKYNLLALPVLEEDGSLAGVITADDVISVLRKR